MTASEKGFIGIGQQFAKDDICIDDGLFDYMLFRRGSFGVNNISIPLGPEVGGGSVERNVVKVGVNSGGVMEFIPRPNTLGHIFYGITGRYTVPADPPYNTHTFDFGADHFAAPYYTVRYAPGNIWGEEFENCRFNMLALEWQAANFVTGTVGVTGIRPNPNKDMSNWGALAKVDSGPQFIAPLGNITLPTGTPAKVLAGSFIAQSAMPLDQQYIVGGYYPQGIDITQRSFMINLTVKLTDGDLYEMVNYDPDQAGAWTAKIFKDANFILTFNSDVEFTNDNAVDVPYALTIEANGAVDDTANVAWTAQPLDLLAQRQVIMQVSGFFLADSAGATPITLSLVTDYTTYATGVDNAVGASTSPSASPSPSASASASGSASVSASASISPSASVSISPSASLSPSASASASSSASLSPSASVSPSPS